MFGQLQTTGPYEKMTANAFPHSAMSRRNSEVVRGQGQSSDCYGFFAEHDLPLSLAACDTDSMAWPHMTFSNADQVSH